MSNSFQEGSPSERAMVLDLLRERRRTLNQEPFSATLVQRRALLNRGILIGASVAGVVAALTGLVVLRRILVQAELGQLRQYEQQAAELRGELQQRQQRIGTLTRVNRELSSALTSGRTSSALLMALQLATPAGVQLLSAESIGPSLVLKGRAFDPMALVRINALQIQLDRLPLMQAKEVKLTKVERQPPAPLQPAPTAAAAALRKTPPPLPPLAFEITGPFATLPPQRQLELLQRYGSEGMARRLQLLRTEGLLP
jgi:type IV pilus assembly protein PilN